MAAVLLGDKELGRKLDRLSRSGSKRAVVAGIRAGMTPIAKAMRAAINSTDASAELKREARKTIGARFGKTRRVAERHAKVGFAVGKRAAAIKRAVGARGKRTGGARPEGQVGASAANIHWFVLGTDKREFDTGPHLALLAGKQGARLRMVPHAGKLEGVFGNVTRQAVASSGGASLAAARRKIKQVIEREAKKKG